MSLHQADDSHTILLNHGATDLTIPFTNKLSDLIILILKMNTNLPKVHQKMECFNLKTFRGHCYT